MFTKTLTASLHNMKTDARETTAVGQVNSIQALRGISAFLVIGYHWAAMLNNVYEQRDLGYLLFLSGFMGVDIFFVISGFVMVLVTHQAQARRVPDFLLKRIFRIVPLAWIATLMWFFLRGGSFDVLLNYAPNLWYGLAFILPGGEAPQFGRGLLDVAWTLTYEFVFYAFFAASMRISGSYRSVITTLSMLLTIFGTQYLIAGSWTLDPSKGPIYTGTFWPPTLVSVLANPLLLEFIPGMWLAELYLRTPDRQWSWPSYVGLLVILLFTAVYLNHPPVPNRLLLCGPWAVILVAGVLLWERLGQLQVPTWLLHLGTLSYSLYLFHYPVEAFVDSVWPFTLFFPGFVGIQKFILYFTFLLVFCTLLHWAVERPCNRLGHRIRT